MAARTIPSARDRLATIMIAPLMTCSARLPVYALLIGAFIPQRAFGMFNLRGLVLFALYLAGVASALGVAFVLKRTMMRGEYRPLLLELPEYRLPHLSNLALGLWERTRIFLEPRRHHHPRPHGGAVVPRQLPGAARGRHRSCHPVQHRRAARSRARIPVRAV